MKKTKNKQKIKWITGLLFTSIVTLFGFKYYEYKHAYEKGILPIFKNDIDYIEMSFNADEGYEYHGKNGTHISIPKSAFRDKNGNLVTENVVVKFREFHDAKSILLSGIPMQMNDQRNNYMQSAGMMEIRAFNGNKELQLGKGKSINVSLAALNKVDENFNLYFLEDNEEWTELGKFETDSNQFKLDGLKAVETIPISPENPQPSDNDFIFLLSMDLKNAPYLKAFDGVEWRMIKDNDEDNPYDELRTGWDHIKIKKIKGKKDVFKITFKREVRLPGSEIVKNDRFSLNAQPVLKGRKLSNALKAYKKDLKQYEILLAQKEVEEQRLALESDLVNNFVVAKLGIWNCDRLTNAENYVCGTYEFDFENEFLPIFNKVKLYVVLNDQNGVLTFNNSDWNNMPFFPDENVELFAILPDLKVAYISSDIYRGKVNKETISKFFTNRIKFNSKIIPKEEAFAYIENLMTNNSITELANN